MTGASRYVKTIVAILGGISAWGITAAADDVFSKVELFGLLGTLATAIGVYALPNKAPAGEAPDPSQSEVGPAVTPDGDPYGLGQKPPGVPAAEFPEDSVEGIEVPR